jgi:hypothetical protein
MFVLEPSLCWVRGQYRDDRYRRGHHDLAGVLERGKGVEWSSREPEKSCVVHVREAGMGDAGIEMPLARKDYSSQ